jgi:hypothetical protein
LHDSVQHRVHLSVVVHPKRTDQSVRRPSSSLLNSIRRSRQRSAPCAPASCMTLSWSCSRRKAWRRLSHRTSQYRPRFPLSAFQPPEILVRPEAKILHLFRLPACFLPKFPARASGLELLPALPERGPVVSVHASAPISVEPFQRPRSMAQSRGIKGACLTGLLISATVILLGCNFGR